MSRAPAASERSHQQFDCIPINSGAQRRRPVLLKAVRSRPEPSGRNRPEPSGRRPEPSRHRRNSAVEHSERNKSHTNYMLTTCSVPSILSCTRRTWKMRKIMSLHVIWRNLYDCKLQNVAPHRNKWSRRRPNGARETSGQLRTVPDGF